MKIDWRDYEYIFMDQFIQANALDKEYFDIEEIVDMILETRRRILEKELLR